MAIAVAALLATVVGLVAATDDGATLVPPPDAVTESFVRQLATHRFSRAVPYMTEELAARLPSELLRQQWMPVEAALGRIDNVTGEPGTRSESQALAFAVAESAAGRRRLSFTLRREKALWKIAAFSFSGSH